MVSKCIRIASTDILNFKCFSGEIPLPPPFPPLVLSSRSRLRPSRNAYTVQWPYHFSKPDDGPVQSLGWESLQHRRYINRIIMLFKIQHGIIDISPDFIQPNDHRTRGSQRLRQLQATNEAYMNSFYPRTISDWNRLPTHVTDLQTLQGFRVALASLYSPLQMPN